MKELVNYMIRDAYICALCALPVSSKAIDETEPERINSRFRKVTQNCLQVSDMLLFSLSLSQRLLVYSNVAKFGSQLHSTKYFVSLKTLIYHYSIFPLSSPRFSNVQLTNRGPTLCVSLGQISRQRN